MQLYVDIRFSGQELLWDIASFLSQPYQSVYCDNRADFECLSSLFCNYSGCQVHGSKFTVSDLVYRNNRMIFAFASELKPWQVMFICQARNLQNQFACRLPTKTETLNP